MKNKFLTSAKITSKGQITVPKIIREMLDVSDGDYIVFYKDKDDNIQITSKDNIKILPEDNKQLIMIKKENKN